MSGSSKLPWGVDNNQLQPGSMKTITDSKLATFAIGKQQKTRFQKTREGSLNLQNSSYCIH